MTGRATGCDRVLGKDTVAKVDVVTVDDVTISKFHWWSKWIDICVFNFGGTGYLLQMRVSRTNAKSFRCAGMTGLGGCPSATTLDAGALKQMKG